MYKQVIIARKDLEMSPGKLSAQVSHASMAFLTSQIKNNHIISTESNEMMEERGNAENRFVKCLVYITEECFDNWFLDSYTKCVLKAKNRNQLLKAKQMAESMGLKENIDFFLIRDNCYTELEPEENGTTLTCIGFRPMDRLAERYVCMLWLKFGFDEGEE